MKDTIDVNATTEQDIPVFKELSEELKCKECNKKCRYYDDSSYSKRTPKTKWECEKEKVKIKTIETIIFAVIEVISILIIYSLLKNIFITIFLAVALVGAMIWFDSEKFDNLLNNRYKKTEEERKKSFAKKVEEIKANNEIIRRRMNGETEEYHAFKNKIINLTGELEKRKSEFVTICENLSKLETDSIEEEFEDNTSSIFKSKKSMKSSSNNSNSQIDELKFLFERLYDNLSKLTDKISPSNFEYAYIYKFYMVHLPSLIENIDIYCSKSMEELSIREKDSFEKLIETFDKKIEHVSNALAEQTENEFISKMENLQRQMLDNKVEE